jgi:4'-phosphopantetheinyl transferase
MRHESGPPSTVTPFDAVVYVIAVPSEPADCDRSVLSRDELAHAARYRFARDRSAFVTTRAAVRRCLASELDVDPREVPIVREPAGRLRLSDDAPATDIDFNVSHSGALAAVALTSGRRVGIDVEERRADRDLRGLVSDVMGVAERAMLGALDDAEFLRAFYACWTRKEAIVKATGLGLGHRLNTIDIPTLPPGGVVHLPSMDASRAVRTWTVRTMELPGDFTLSVALAGAGGQVGIIRWTDPGKAPSPDVCEPSLAGESATGPAGCKSN